MDKQEMTLEKKIEQWKQKYGEVYRIDVNAKSEEELLPGEEMPIKTCFVKKPDRKTLSAASVVGQKDPMKYNEVMLKNCWIEGDEDIMTDDGLFLGACGQLSEIVQVREGQLKKL